MIDTVLETVNDKATNSLKKKAKAVIKQKESTSSIGMLEAAGRVVGKWTQAAAGTWWRSLLSGKRYDEVLARFLGRGTGRRTRRFAAAGDGAGLRRQVHGARPDAGSLLQMASFHGGVESAFGDGWRRSIGRLRRPVEVTK